MAAVLELLNKQPLVGFPILVAVILIVPVFFQLLAAGALLWFARVEFPAVCPASDSGGFGNQ
ncbi:MAG: hypothetical protein KME26_09090 [Oscillatoria princeps RMCB-10]|jgi:hypothetical protein|nr:hypothetical protein [Oscillatoria princeps RMCB-10]